jgi:hypothetical protein
LGSIVTAIQIYIERFVASELLTSPSLRECAPSGLCKDRYSKLIGKRGLIQRPVCKIQGRNGLPASAVLRLRNSGKGRKTNTGLPHAELKAP